MGPYRGYTRRVTPPARDQQPVSLDYLGDDAMLGKIEHEAPELRDVNMDGLAVAHAGEIFNAMSLGRTMKVRRVPNKRAHEISHAEFLYLVRRKPGLLYAKTGEDVVVLVRDNPFRQAVAEAKSSYISA